MKTQIDGAEQGGAMGRRGRVPLALSVPLLMAGLAGCEGTISCDALPAIPALAACVAPQGGWVEGWYDATPFTLALSGEVLAVGEGSPPDGCFDRSTGSPMLSETEAELNAAWWFQASDDKGAVWTVGVSFPGLSQPLQVGDPIQAAYRYSFGGWTPEVGALTVSRADGSLIAHIEQELDVSDLTLPSGISVSQGAEVCTQENDCGTWQAYDLEASVGDSSGTLSYGATSSIGGYSFVHAGYKAETSATDHCQDWYVGNVMVGIAGPE